MRSRLLLVSLCAVLLPACGGNEKQSDQRVVVFGVDGLDPEMLQERIDRGLLPNFAKLVDTSVFQPLQTSWPPQSPVAWTNFTTGSNPGRHGLYDFIHVDRHNYGLLNSMSETDPVGFEISLAGYKIPVTGGDTRVMRRMPAFWEVLDEAGVPVFVHRMPANYPLVDTNAVTFPDMGFGDITGEQAGKAFLWTEDPSKQDKDGTSYYIRRVSVNRLRLEVEGGKGIIPIPAQLYGPEDSARDLDDLEHEMAVLNVRAREANSAGETARAREYGNRIAEIKREIADERETFLPFTTYLDYTGPEPVVTIEVEDHYGIAKVGEWTDWVPVEFSMVHGMVAMKGWTRFLFKSHQPFELYAAPIQIDPYDPATPVSTPDDASAEMAAVIGPYHTQGFPDAYKAYKAKLLNTAEFVSQSDTVIEERRHMLDYACDQLDESGGLLFFYTGSLDLRSHMLWHAQDLRHPYQEETGSIDDPDLPGYSQQLDRIYKQVDDMLGHLMHRLEAMEADGEAVKLIIMSDHGFAPFYRRMNVNDWLVQEGYMVLREGKTSGDVGAMGIDAEGGIDWDSSVVDWSQTQAYTVGFNGVILNRVEREPKGIVSDQQAEPLLEEIRNKLLALHDDNGEAVFRRVLLATEVFEGEMTEFAPDLQLGFSYGYGASDDAASGKITGTTVMEDNLSRWSGSHLMDPEVVRGTIIVRNGQGLSKDPALEDITATLYHLFDVEPPAGVDGKPLF